MAEDAEKVEIIFYGRDKDPSRRPGGPGFEFQPLRAPVEPGQLRAASSQI